MKSEVYNCDCMELMAKYPDNHFELAIVDPPYGIDVINKVYKGREGKITTKGGGFQVRGTFAAKDWDSKPPTKQYFKELQRVSRDQIICGSNNFSNLIPPSSGWIFWDKCTGSNDFSDGEFIYTSFSGRGRMFRYMWNGMLQGKGIKNGHINQGNKLYCEKKIHPTQKPVALYKWLLINYAKEGDKILDTHLGSGSSRIAAHDMGFDFVGCELDKEYFNKAEFRYQEHIKQMPLF